jgi:folate-binding protein YgfZ
MAEPTPLPDVAVGYEYAHTGTVVFDSSQRGKVVVSGADAARFLHNLSTNDILNLAAGNGCEAFLTTHKARVVAYLHVYHLPGPEFWLDVAPGMAQSVIQHLDRYLISEQVEFRDATADLGQLQVAGPSAAPVLTELFGQAVVTLSSLQVVVAPTPRGDYQVRRQDALGLSGYDVLCPADKVAELAASLNGREVRLIGPEVYEALRIEAGTPEWGLDIDENTFAPEVGRTAQAICYTKGCYLGQEPIVMARDRGHVNRLLTRIRLPGGAVPHNSPLFLQGKEVGRVTSSATMPGREGAVGLAYVRRGLPDTGTALEVDMEGQRLPAIIIGRPERA